MLTLTDIRTFEPAYRSARAKLRLATNIDAQAVATWMRPRRDRIAAGYAATGEEGSLLDFEAYIRHQYARAMGKAV